MRFAFTVTACALLVLALTTPVVAQRPVSIDLNGNGHRDFEDFLLFAQAYGSSAEQCDYDGSGQVDFGDFLIQGMTLPKVTARYGASPFRSPARNRQASV